MVILEENKTNEEEQEVVISPTDNNDTVFQSQTSRTNLEEIYKLAKKIYDTTK